MQQTQNNRPISLLCIISKDLESCACIVHLTIMSNNSPVLSSITFLRNRLLHFTTATYLNAIGQNLEEIFKQILSTWTWLRLLIPLITKLCLQKLKRYGAEGGTHLWFTDYLSGGFGKCCLVIDPKLHRKFLRAAYLVQFYLLSLLKSYCVCMRRRIWVQLFWTGLPGTHIYT